MKNALVVGGAKCVFRDLEEASFFIPDVIIAINDIGMELGRVNHWVTMHPEKLDNWNKERLLRGKDQPVLWTALHRGVDKYPEFKRTASHMGSSAMLAVDVALNELGCERVVLAGCPLEINQGHFFNPRRWFEAEVYRKEWIKRYDELKDKVRSVSGWTMDTFGRPTMAWLKEAS